MDDIPTHVSGRFAEWFESFSPEDIGRLYENASFRSKIEKQLRGSGSKHEMLMVAEAPTWARWGATVNDVQETFAITIARLNEGGLAKNWKHSTGLRGSRAPNSTKVHRQLQRIIRESTSLDDFKERLRPWAEEWINGGHEALMRELK